MRIRKKGVALVETDNGILMVRESGNDDFSLPGGGADRGESRKSASMRELREETGMIPRSAEYLCSYLGDPFKGFHGDMLQNDVKVFVVQADGVPWAVHEIVEVAWWNPGCDLPLCRGLWRTLEIYQKCREDYK
jgi:ADP-ribose pyrophosphatase YjhB (NUDIX family)